MICGRDSLATANVYIGVEGFAHSGIEEKTLLGYCTGSLCSDVMLSNLPSHWVTLETS